MEARAPQADKAWEWFRSIGSPKYHVAPMVDQSELPFRMVCRENGATCAYTPMFHARLFVQDAKYRKEQWSTCAGDRPLFVQFCANDPAWLAQAAQIVAPPRAEGGDGDGEAPAPFCDAIDINLGCPQRIAKRGRYGAFLMDDLPLVQSLVEGLVNAVNVPVTVKIRIFPDIEQTLAYARMIEAAGASLLAVHGRTREMKDASMHLPDWEAIRRVKAALSIPVLGNGGVRTREEAEALMQFTGVDGVLSAEPLLCDPALFADRRLTVEGRHSWREALDLAARYLDLAAGHRCHTRMVRGHVHRILAPWLAEYTHIRDRVNVGRNSIEDFQEAIAELRRLVTASGRDSPRVAPREELEAAKRAEREAAKQAAMAEQERETESLAALAALEASADVGQVVTQHSCDALGVEDATAFCWGGVCSEEACEGARET